MENSWNAINSKINLILTWSTNSTISSNTNTNQSTTSEITDTKPYILVVTLPRNENAKTVPTTEKSF